MLRAARPEREGEAAVIKLTYVTNARSSKAPLQFPR
jgi:hypothetical protein